MTRTSIMLLVALMASASAQSPESAKTKLDLGLYAGVIASNGLDWASTNQCVRRPDICREAELPEALVSNKAGWTSYEAAKSVGTIYAAHWLTQHGHPRVARWGLLAVDMLTMAQGAYNYTLCTGARKSPVSPGLPVIHPVPLPVIGHGN